MRAVGTCYAVVQSGNARSLTNDELKALREHIRITVSATSKLLQYPDLVHITVPLIDEFNEVAHELDGLYAVRIAECYGVLGDNWPAPLSIRELNIIRKHAWHSYHWMKALTKNTDALAKLREACDRLDNDYLDRIEARRK